MAEDRWLIRVDLDTTGIQRGVRETANSLRALESGAYSGGVASSAGAIGPARQVQALGSPTTVSTDILATSRGEMRSLMAAQGQVAALMQAQLAASSRVVGRQIQDLNRFGDLYFDRLKTQIRGFQFFAPQQQAEIERVFSDAFTRKSNELFAALNNIRIEDLSDVFNKRIEREAALIAIAPVAGAGGGQQVGQFQPPLAVGSRATARYTAELEKLLASQAAPIRQYNNLLEQSVGYQNQIIRSQKEIVAANRFAAQSTRDRIARTYSQVLALAAGVARPTPAARELPRPSQPAYNTPTPFVRPLALPAPRGQQEVVALPVIAPQPVVPAVASTFRREARSQVQQALPAITIVVPPTVSAQRSQPSVVAENYGEGRLPAAEQNLVLALQNKAQALARQTGVITGVQSRFAAAEVSLVTALESKAAAVGAIPTGISYLAAAPAVQAGALPVGARASQLPAGSVAALPPYTMGSSLAQRTYGERIGPPTSVISDTGQVIDFNDIIFNRWQQDNALRNAARNADRAWERWQQENALQNVARQALPGPEVYNRPYPVSDPRQIAGQSRRRRRPDIDYFQYDFIREPWIDEATGRHYHDMGTTYNAIYRPTGRIVGSLSNYIGNASGFINEESDITLDDLAVNPQFRGNQIAKNLSRIAIQDAVLVYGRFPLVSSTLSSDSSAAISRVAGVPVRQTWGTGTKEDLGYGYDNVRAEDDFASSLLYGQQMQSGTIYRALTSAGRTSRQSQDLEYWDARLVNLNQVDTNWYEEYIRAIAEEPAIYGLPQPEVYNRPSPSTWVSPDGVRLLNQSTNQPPAVGYRVVPDAEYQDYLAQGVIRSKAGQIHVSAIPNKAYPFDYDPKAPHHVLEIDMSKDRYEAKYAGGEMAGVYRGSLPLDRVRNVTSFPDRAAFKAADLERLALPAPEVYNQPQFRRVGDFQFAPDLTDQQVRALNNELLLQQQGKILGAPIGAGSQAIASNFKAGNGVYVWREEYPEGLNPIQKALYEGTGLPSERPSASALARTETLRATYGISGVEQLAAIDALGNAITKYVRGKPVSEKGVVATLPEMQALLEAIVRQGYRGVFPDAGSTRNVIYGQPSGFTAIDPISYPWITRRPGISSAITALSGFLGDSDGGALPLLSRSPQNREIKEYIRSLDPEQFVLSRRRQLELEAPQVYNRPDNAIGIPTSANYASGLEAYLTSLQAGLPNLLGGIRTSVVNDTNTPWAGVLNPGRGTLSLNASVINALDKLSALGAPGTELGLGMEAGAANAVAIHESVHALVNKLRIEGETLDRLAREAGFGIGPGTGTTSEGFVASPSGVIGSRNILSPQARKNSEELAAEAFAGVTFGGVTDSAVVQLTELVKSEARSRPGGNALVDDLENFAIAAGVAAGARAGAVATPGVDALVGAAGATTTALRSEASAENLLTGAASTATAAVNALTASLNALAAAAAAGGVAAVQALAGGARSLPRKQAQAVVNTVTTGGTWEDIAGISGIGAGRLSSLQAGASASVFGPAELPLALTAGDPYAAARAARLEAARLIGGVDGTPPIRLLPGIGVPIPASGPLALPAGNPYAEARARNLRELELLARSGSSSVVGGTLLGQSRAGFAGEFAGLPGQLELVSPAEDARKTARDAANRRQRAEGDANARATEAARFIADNDRLKLNYREGLAFDAGFTPGLEGSVERSYWNRATASGVTNAQRSSLYEQFAIDPDVSQAAKDEGRTRREAAAARQEAAKERQRQEREAAKTPKTDDQIKAEEEARAAERARTREARNRATYDARVRTAQSALDRYDFKGLGANERTAILERGYRPVEYGAPGFDVWEAARRGDWIGAENARKGIRSQFSSDELGNAARRAAELEQSLLTDWQRSQTEGLPLPDDFSERSRQASRYRSEYGLTNRDIAVGQYQNYLGYETLADTSRTLRSRALLEPDRANAAAMMADADEIDRRLAEGRRGVPRQAPPGFDQWVDYGAEGPVAGPGVGGRSGRGGGGGRGGGPDGFNGFGWEENERPGSLPRQPGESRFDAFRRQIREGDGAGNWLAGGALSVARYAIPSMLLFGAGAGIANSLREAEELRLNFARLETQLENTFGMNAEDKIEGVKNKIIDLAKQTGIGADLLAEMEIRIRGAFQDEELQTQQGTTVSGEQLVDRQRESAAKIALVTKLPADKVLDELTAVSLAYGVDSDYIGNVLSAVSESGGVGAAELLDFISTIGPIGVESGFSVEDIFALGAVTTQTSGSSGAALGEQFRRILPMLTNSNTQTELLALAAPLVGTGEGQIPVEFLDAVREGSGKDILYSLGTFINDIPQQNAADILRAIGADRQAGVLLGAVSRNETLDKLTEVGQSSDGALEARVEKIRASLSNTIARTSEEFRELTRQVLELGLSDVFMNMLSALRLIATATTTVLGVFVEINQLLNGLPAKLLAFYAIYRLIQFGGAKLLPADQASGRGAGFLGALPFSGLRGRGVSSTQGFNEFGPYTVQGQKPGLINYVGDKARNTFGPALRNSLARETFLDANGQPYRVRGFGDETNRFPMYGPTGRRLGPDGQPLTGFARLRGWAQYNPGFLGRAAFQFERGRSGAYGFRAGLGGLGTGVAGIAGRVFDSGASTALLNAIAPPSIRRIGRTFTDEFGRPVGTAGAFRNVVRSSISEAGGLRQFATGIAAAPFARLGAVGANVRDAVTGFGSAVAGGVSRAGQWYNRPTLGDGRIADFLDRNQGFIGKWFAESGTTGMAQTPFIGPRNPYAGVGGGIRRWADQSQFVEAYRRFRMPTSYDPITGASMPGAIPGASVAAGAGRLRSFVGAIPSALQGIDFNANFRNIAEAYTRLFRTVSFDPDTGQRLAGPIPGVVQQASLASEYASRVRQAISNVPSTIAGGVSATGRAITGLPSTIGAGLTGGIAGLRSRESGLIGRYNAARIAQIEGPGAILSLGRGPLEESSPFAQPVAGTGLTRGAAAFQALGFGSDGSARSRIRGVLQSTRIGQEYYGNRVGRPALPFPTDEAGQRLSGPGFAGGPVEGAGRFRSAIRAGGGGLAGAAAAGGSLALSGLGAIAGFVATPLFAITALITLYSSITEQIQKDKQKLQELAQANKKANDEARNLSLGGDSTALPELAQDYRRRATYSRQNQSAWSRTWRGVTWARTNAEADALDQQAYIAEIASPENMQQFEALIGNTQIQDDLNYAIFGESQGISQEDYIAQREDMRNNMEGLKFESTAVEVPEANRRFRNQLERIGGYSDSDEIDQRIINAVLAPDSAGELQKLIDEGVVPEDQKDNLARIVDYYGKTATERQEIDQRLKEQEINALPTGQKIGAKIEDVRKGFGAGVISVRDYADQARDIYTDTMRLARSGNTEISQDEIIAAETARRQAESEISGSLLARARSTEQFMQALGSSESSVNKAMISRYGDLIRSGDIQDPTALADAATSLLTATREFYGNLIAQADSTAEVQKILDDMANDENYIAGITAMINSQIQNSDAFASLRLDGEPIGAVGTGTGPGLPGNYYLAGTPVEQYTRAMSDLSDDGQFTDSTRNQLTATFNTYAEQLQDKDLSDEDRKELEDKLAVLFYLLNAAGGEGGAGVTLPDGVVIDPSIAGPVQSYIEEGQKAAKKQASANKYETRNAEYNLKRAYALGDDEEIARLNKEQAAADLAQAQQEYDDAEKGTQEETDALNALNEAKARYVTAEYEQAQAARQKKFYKYDIERAIAEYNKDPIAAANATINRANAVLNDPEASDQEKQQALLDSIAGQAARRDAINEAALRQYDLGAARAPQGAAVQSIYALARAREQRARAVGIEIVDADIAVAEAERAVRQAQDARVQALARAFQAGVKDSVWASNIGVSAAQMNAEAIRREYGADSAEYFDALAEVEQAEAAQRSALAARIRAMFAHKAARTNDDLWNANDAVTMARQLVAEARRGGNIDEIIAAETELANAEKAQRAAYRARVEAMYANLNARTRDPLQQADNNIQMLNALLADAKKANDIDAIIDIETQLLDAQRTAADAMQDVRMSAMELRQAELAAMEDDVGAAQVARQQAQAALQYGIDQGVGEAEINRLRASVITADKAAQDAVYTDRREEYQYMLDMGEISKSTYMAHIKNLQSTVIPGSKKFKEIELELKRLKDDMSSDLSVNMPSTLGLPTVYEIRRMNQQTSYNAGGSPVGYDNSRQLNINGVSINSGMDFQQFVQAMAQFMGVPGTSGDYTPHY